MNYPIFTLQKKSEEYFRKYLKNITNDQLRQFYDDVECTPFPVLVIKEYQHRFNTKNKEVIEKLKIHGDTIKKKNSKPTSDLKKRGSKVTPKIKEKKISMSAEEANLVSLSNKYFTILEKLSQLAKQGIVTNKEFQNKKNEILKRI